MLARVLAVARMNALEFIHGRVALGYLCLLAFALAFSNGVESPVPRLISACGSGGWVAALLALNSVFTETRQRTLAAVMVRPIARGEYLAGRTLAATGLFLGFVLLCLVLALGFGGGSISGAHLQQFATHAVKGVTWITLVLPLAALLKPWPCASLLVGCKVLDAMADKLSGYSQVLATLRPVCWYLSLTEIVTADTTTWLATLLDNLAYAVVVFLACLWLYERQDVRLRES